MISVEPESSPVATLPTEISEDEFRRRAKAVIEDYTTTTTGAVPNLGKVLSLKDEAGNDIMITNGYSSLAFQWYEEIDGEFGERRVFFDESSFNTGSVGLRLHSAREVLEFVEGKITKLLAPLKTELVSRSEDQ